MKQILIIILITATAFTAKKVNAQPHETVHGIVHSEPHWSETHRSEPKLEEHGTRSPVTEVTTHEFHPNYSSDHAVAETERSAANINSHEHVSTNSKVGKRRDGFIPDKGEPNSTKTNKSGTTTKKYGPDGNVQKEYNKGHTYRGTPKNELTDHIHDYKPNPRNPSGHGDGRFGGRPPKRNELKKDFKL